MICSETILKRLPSKCVSYAWVARGSRGSRAGRARVANFNSRSGNTRVARGPSAEYILLLLSRGSVSDPRPIQNKHRVRSLSGERGFTKVAATEKLSGRESGISGLSPPTKKAFGKTMATTNTGKHYKTTTTDEDERRLQATSERRLYV